MKINAASFLLLILSSVTLTAAHAAKANQPAGSASSGPVIEDVGGSLSIVPPGSSRSGQSGSSSARDDAMKKFLKGLPPGFDPSILPKDFDPSKMPADFDYSKVIPGYRMPGAKPAQSAPQAPQSNQGPSAENTTELPETLFNDSGEA